MRERAVSLEIPSVILSRLASTSLMYAAGKVHFVRAQTVGAEGGAIGVCMFRFATACAVFVGRRAGVFVVSVNKTVSASQRHADIDSDSHDEATVQSNFGGNKVSEFQKKSSRAPDVTAGGESFGGDGLST